MANGTFWLKTLIVVALYWVLGHFGIGLATINNHASPVWPSSGLAIAAIVLWGWSMVPAIWLGAFIVNIQTSSPLVAVLIIACGNTCEAAAGAYIYQQIMKLEKKFGVMVFALATVAAAFAATPVSAIFGVLGLVLTKTIPSSGIDNAIFTWWLGDTLGAFIFLPFFLNLEPVLLQIKSSAIWKKPSYWLSLVKDTVLCIGAGGLSAWMLIAIEGLPFLCGAVPILAFTTWRKSALTRCFVTVTISLVAILITVRGGGGFQSGIENENLINLQLFLISLAAANIFLEVLFKLGASKLAVIALIVSSLLGAVFIINMWQQEVARDESHFNVLIKENQDRIVERLNAYVNGSLSASAFLSVLDKPFVDASTWRRYTSELAMEKRFPGIRGIGVVIAVQDQELPAYAATRKKTDLSFFVHPIPGKFIPGDTEHFIVDVVEPNDRNARSLGLDLSSDPRRKQALELARATGTAVISEPILFPQGKGVIGFILVAPAKIGEAYESFIYVPFEANEVFKNISFVGFEEIELSVAVASESDSPVFNSRDLSLPAAPIHKNSAIEQRDRPLDQFTTVTSITVANRPFQLTWSRLSTFHSAHDTTLALVSTFIAMASLILSGMLANLEVVGVRAEILARDIGKQLEKQRLATFQASKMSTLGEMAGGIAHEINNPLTIIGGFSTQLLHDFKSGEINKEAALHKIERINATVTRISKIVAGLRAFSRSGERDPKIITPVVTLVNNVLDLCRERFLNTGIELRVVAGTDISVRANVVQLEQVIMNLMSNAYDAVRNLPVTALGNQSSSRWVEISIAKDESHVLIHVTDSGRGIPDEVVQRIMDPFFTTKEIGKGTGLGLSISKGIIGDHNGELIYDKNSANTRFTVKLPAALI